MERRRPVECLFDVPDVTIERVGDLVRYDLAALLGARRGMEEA